MIKGYHPQVNYSRTTRQFEEYGAVVMVAQCHGKAACGKKGNIKRKRA
jgi:hypothetical protein